LSWAGVRFYRAWSERKGIVDVPNERSSHAAPTPRGGGVVIAAVCLGGYALAAYSGGHRISWGYLAGAMLIVTISWLDDVKSVSSLSRLLCHAVAAVVVVADAGPMPIGSFSPTAGFEVDWPIDLIAKSITVFWIVWLVNAYNFMDGIDGIASLQAVLAAAGWAVLAAATGASLTSAFSTIVMAASLGFLLQNWQPAKIFMGDSGSAFLGYTFAVMPLLAARDQPDAAAKFATVSVLFVWFFVFDSVLTFFVRLFNREKVWRPHRKHLYQRLVIAGNSHGLVSTLYGVMTAVTIATSLAAFLLAEKWTALPLFIIAGFSAVLALLAFRKKNLLT
jgi:UDP-N-acetylmuramyl pentapeptide phosphotransferase/UDP-N-acetylglucosamine-1-phosphate transferase